jgi:hypothetical protein
MLEKSHLRSTDVQACERCTSWQPTLLRLLCMLWLRWGVLWLLWLMLLCLMLHCCCVPGGSHTWF